MTYEPPQAGTTSSRGTLGPVIHSTYPYPTYGGVGTASGGLQGARRLTYDPSRIGYDQGGKGVNLYSYTRDRNVRPAQWDLRSYSFHLPSGLLLTITWNMVRNMVP